MIKIKVHIASY